MNTDINSKSSLLIIDDFLDNIKLLLSFLTDAGFKVLIARDGEQGIKTAQYAKPDLILLDIMMPGLNGFETCQQLKQAEETKNIPIIFMTALTDLNEKIKGFELGAADYITKPFQHAELLARINTHLSVIRLQQQLEKRNLEAEAFARTVAHDLKAPLAGVLGLIDVLKEKFQESNVVDADDIENIHLIEQSAKQMNEIILALLMLAGVSSNQEVICLPLDMSGILQSVLHRVEYIRKEYQGIIEYPKEFPLAMGYAPWIEEVWANYLINGLKYSGRPPHLIITANIQNNYVKFSVKDNGQGLSLEDQKKLFIPFARLSNGDHTGHGLGLSIVQQIISKLNGNVGIESQIGDGCLFYFTLPLFSETIH
ncbi:histidine kinase,Response regulator receiver domain protein,histidine kinase [Beggiatoa alba B18LD]|uniref:histidine kinase n=1 Tax=Beggiatoa alba B18LD TaxID=395493 RepID=I3CCZ9_9GAMM|nr:hybrid sensor histidine kinase/response regulator [Beggiatoa alba]EIJ41492.1 histidine kinase,Response regulator receiver domain protein,histidine kinase [Beggiatoa alba B18LD]